MTINIDKKIIKESGKRLEKKLKLIDELHNANSSESKCPICHTNSSIAFEGLCVACRCVYKYGKPFIKSNLFYTPDKVKRIREIMGRITNYVYS